MGLICQNKFEPPKMLIVNSEETKVISGLGHPKSTSEIELLDGRMTDEKDL